MIRPGMIFAVAAGESRIARRLVRYWAFTLVAGLAAAFMYGWYAFIHYVGSSYSATVAMINPRFVMGFAAFWFLCIFFIGLVVLAFEVRARDTRERIAEVRGGRAGRLRAEFL